MIQPSLWPPHWGFVLASYGLVITVLTVMVGSSLFRLRRATKRLALLQRLQKMAADQPDRQEND
ncbi:heme exporter protein CcmD [Bombella sp. TMW 2.2559]|uniref:Heme exporter protein D n=1 Tax=Bombella dulcis TaxID=2967339 RepID=A0ABT3WDF0_9PROT|nr:heme exporter protein CcmD [Bombella dulcis]MCX5616290.1 heme exporter protein CcmD [Bombella dulcis]